MKVVTLDLMSSWLTNKTVQDSWTQRLSEYLNSGVGLGLKGWIIRASGEENFELQNYQKKRKVNVDYIRLLFC